MHFFPSWLVLVPFSHICVKSKHWITVVRSFPWLWLYVNKTLVFFAFLRAVVCVQET